MRRRSNARFAEQAQAGAPKETKKTPHKNLFVTVYSSPPSLRDTSPSESGGAVFDISVIMAIPYSDVCVLHCCALKLLAK